MVSDRLAADVEILRDRQIREDAPVLRHEAQPPPRDLERLELGDVLAQEADGSAALRDQRHQRLERRGFAGAIASHERDHLAAADMQGQLEQDLRRPVPRLEILHLEHGRAHGRAPAAGVKARPVPR